MFVHYLMGGLFVSSYFFQFFILLLMKDINVSNLFWTEKGDK